MQSQEQKVNLQKQSEEKVFQVGAYLDFLNEILEPARAIVQGEIGEVSERPKYTFFNLLDKEEKAVLSCFIWNARLAKLGVELEEGMEIKVEGYPQVFKRSGRFNFEVENIGLVGEGVLRQAFEKLKEKLFAAGFFAEQRKKEIPPFVEKIGLITSSFADAKTDFLTHLGKFGFKIYFMDVRVEGFYSVGDIVSALRWFNENLTDLEVLVLTRGGGNLENLQAFNNEEVAKAIFASKIPVLTGIGHESDETIADLVADYYASTPTHAARVLSDPWRNAYLLVSTYEESIISAFTRNIADFEQKLAFFSTSLESGLRNFLTVESERVNYFQKNLTFLFQAIFGMYQKAEAKFRHNLEKLENKVAQGVWEIEIHKNNLQKRTQQWLKFLWDCIIQMEEKLKLVDPQARLKQGYSLVFSKEKKIVKSSEQIEVDEDLSLKFYKGGAISRVKEIHS